MQRSYFQLLLKVLPKDGSFTGTILVHTIDFRCTIHTLERILLHGS